jgi:Zn-dependent M28 family amino/carboxypeptidase
MTLRRFIVALAAVALGSFATLAAQPAAKVHFTAQDLMSSITRLASPAMEGRRTGTPGNAKARAWIISEMRSAGLEPLGADYQMPFTFERNGTKQSGVNVGGVCKGQGAKDTGAMVITAHYDHLGVRDGATHHGADDNASGVAVLLALARQCRQSPWTHDALLVALDAEEQGLQGARALVAAPPIAKERLAININLDMVARGDKGELYIAGTHHRPALKPILQPVASRAPVKLLFGHDSGGGHEDWTSQSDHGAFHAAGIPFIYFGVEDHPDYHKPTDTVDKIDAAFFYRAATTILDAVTTLDRSLHVTRQ